MTIDYNGLAVIIAAVAAAFVSIGTFILQWRANSKADKNKVEAIAAREHQTATIIDKAVTPALNATPPATSTNPDDKGP